MGDDPPNLGVVDQVVAMDQQVAKSNDVGMVTDAGSSFGVGPCQAADRFANDLEVAFDGLPKGAIAR